MRSFLKASERALRTFSGRVWSFDDSEAVQTARRAKELLDKLAEYKPLAKIEELTEQNYNQIDNVLNNGFEQKKEEKEKEARGEKGNKCPSLKKRLEEKKNWSSASRRDRRLKKRRIKLKARKSVKE